MRTNLQGPYFLTQAIAREQVERRRGGSPAFAAAIVFITSVSAEMASVNRGDYCVSKAGLSMAARLFAVRLARRWHSGLRSAAGHHRDRHDGRASKSVYDAASPTGWCPNAAGARPKTSAGSSRRCCAATRPYATGTVINVDGGLSRCHALVDLEGHDRVIC